MGILEIYKKEQFEKIDEKYRKEIENSKKRPILEQVLKMKETFEEEYHKLFLSQLTEEEKNNFLIGIPVDVSAKDLIKYNIEIEIPSNLCKTQEEKDLESKIENEKEQLISFLDKVSSHISIAASKDEIEEILIRYGILDKKTKMISEEIWTAKKN